MSTQKTRTGKDEIAAPAEQPSAVVSSRRSSGPFNSPGPQHPIAQNPEFQEKLAQYTQGAAEVANAPIPPTGPAPQGLAQAPIPPQSSPPPQGLPVGSGMQQPYEGPPIPQPTPEELQAVMRQPAEPFQRPAMPPVNEPEPEPYREDSDGSSYRADNDVNDLIINLRQQLVRAHQIGDDAMVNKLQSMLIAAGSDPEEQPKRVRKQRAQHPVMARLIADLGLQRIKPVTIEWGGFAWLFHPAPPVLDRWVWAMSNEVSVDLPAARIASMLVGLDDAPIYEVLGIDTVAKYDVPGGKTEEPVELFQKFCPACGMQVSITFTQCDCGAALDPYDMPLALRTTCAQACMEFFQKDFGPYEELANLYEIVHEKMPSRITNKEELYPLVARSQKS